MEKTLSKQKVYISILVVSRYITEGWLWNFPKDLISEQKYFLKITAQRTKLPAEISKALNSAIEFFTPAAFEKILHIYKYISFIKFQHPFNLT